MTQTPNYNLNVIAQTDDILQSVTALGANASSLDTILTNKQDYVYPTLTQNITCTGTVPTFAYGTYSTGNYYLKLDNYIIEKCFFTYEEHGEVSGYPAVYVFWNVFSLKDIYYFDGVEWISKTLAKTTALNSSSTHWQLPTAKATYDYIGRTTSISSASTDLQTPTAKAVYDATLHNYSTTEQVVGTWIDSKPLYEKVISGTMPNVTTDGTYASLNFTIGSNLDYVFIMAQWIEHTDGRKIPLPYMTNNASINTRGTISADKKYDIVSGISAFKNLPVKAIVRYTKTTDTV